jgi:hypothetical protein
VEFRLDTEYFPAHRDYYSQASQGQVSGSGKHRTFSRTPRPLSLCPSLGGKYEQNTASEALFGLEPLTSYLFSAAV